MITIALDAMGGDFAPRVPVAAAAQASREGFASILLVGDQAALAQELARHRHDSRYVHILHAPQTVGMEDAASSVLREKPQASVRVACELVAAGQAQAVVSAGHSGALMVAGKHALGALPGMERPAIVTTLPLRHGATALLDSGANVDCKPHYLLQFAQVGAVYARRVLGVAAPRVGLLSNGAEPGKGNDLVRQAYALLAASGLDFVGNVEARDLFKGRADVLVCDGFVGNVVLKTAEAVSQQLRLLTKDAALRSPLAMLGYALARPFFAELLRRTDYHEIGGSPLLGLGHVAIVCHGSSNASTIASALRVAARCVEQGLVGEIARAMATAGAG